METVELGLALFLAVAAMGALARWTPLPLPMLLVIGGAALSFVPGLSGVRLDPDVFFLLFVPLLLFGDGWQFPKREFVNYLRPILLLALGLVAMTVVVVGYLMHWLIPSLPLAAAFTLGAIVSPTDAVATAAVTARLPLPSRAAHILNGESLINDASGLVAFKFAVAAVATGAFSWIGAGEALVLLAGGGALVGLAVAAVIGELRVRLVRFCVDDPTIQTMVSLLTPYAAYLAAEHLHVSGILAVVAAGLYAGVHDTRHLSVATRRHAWEVWAMLLYVFNGLAFLLLGLQLKSVLEGMRGESWTGLVVYALALFAAITLVRVIWVYPSTYLPLLLSRRIREREGWRDPRAVFLVGWAGIRGSVTLAAALSIPFATATGTAFPDRDLILFLAGTTIVLTLAINGLTLPALIRVLDVRGDRTAEREERAARLAVSQAAANAVRIEIARLKRPEEIAFAERLIADYDAKLHRHSANGPRRQDLDNVAAAERRLKLTALAAERAELHSLRDTLVINEQTLRAIEAEIDHAETLVVGVPRAGH
ncbi:MAG TPA: Na+/H+ antiporter [Casimicrobiaceae bacterium]